MITATLKPTMPEKHYLNDNYGIRSWLLTKDHERIAILYLISITFLFFLGGLFAALIRLQLLTPNGALFLTDTYNKLFTMHGGEHGLFLPGAIRASRAGKLTEEMETPTEAQCLRCHP
jgi:hypothetical protein